MAMTDSAITLNEALAALDAIDTSQGAEGASVGGVKSAPPVLRVDFSERQSALLDLAQASGDFDVRLERLAVGDYVVGAGVLVERKTYADFAMSLVDGRLFLQAAALARSPYRPVILLEGPKPSRMPDVHPHALKGAIVSLAVMWRLPIVHAHDPEDALWVLRCLADQIDRTEPGVLKRYDRKPKRLASKKNYMLQGLPGIGPALADRLLLHFRTVENIITADETTPCTFRVLGARRRDGSERSFLAVAFIGVAAELLQMMLQSTRRSWRSARSLLRFSRECQHPLLTGCASERLRFTSRPDLSPHQDTTDLRPMALLTLGLY